MGAARAESTPGLVPVDIVAIVAYVLLAQVIWILPAGSFARFVIGLPLVVFLPGFVLTTTLFPDGGGGESGPEPAIDRIERLGLSFGLSVAIVPLLGFGLWIAQFDLAATIVPATIVWILFVGAISWIRRIAIPPERRYVPRLPAGGWSPIRSDSVLDTTLGIVLIATIVLASGTLAFGLVSPQPGEAYTQFMVGSLEDGEFTIGDYPSQLTVDEAATYTLVLENNEGEPVEYVVAVELERVEDGVVVERERLSTHTIASEPGQRLALDVDVVPPEAGEDRRLAFLLFKDGVPSDADREAADQVLHVWVDIADD